jgi:hypothetical protein
MDRMLRFDQYGQLAEDTAGMFSPVRCTWCRRVYDLGKVEVTARYTDCSMWKAPCCGRTVDDRGDTGWKSRKDYEHLRR